MNYYGKGIIYDTLSKQYYQHGKFCQKEKDNAEKVQIGQAIHIVEGLHRHISYSLEDAKERRYIIIPMEE